MNATKLISDLGLFLLFSRSFAFTDPDRRRK